MKTFEEFMVENVSSRRGNANTFYKDNKDRVGKTYINANGSEVNGSVVLSGKSFVYKKGSSTVYVVFDVSENKMVTVEIDSEEAKLLKRFL